MIEFLNGIHVALSALAGLLFLKFWFGTKQRLFLWFALAFWILAANRIALVALRLYDPQFSEHQMIVYIVRLFAYVLILAAIIDRNRRNGGRATRPQ